MTRQPHAPREPATRAPDTLPPLLERLAGGWGVRLQARSRSRAATLATFRRETDRVLTLAAGVPEATARAPRRIRRLPGMEPGSQDWSVYMTLQHLVIVDRGIAAVIHALCADHNPGVEIRVEDLQPHPDAGPEQLESLARAAERYGEIVECFGSLRCREQYPHPWFGALNAWEWNVLAAWHTRVHRLHIERLLRA